jgi:translocation and assembly module TamB
LEEFGGSILGLDLEIKTHSTERSRRTIKLMGKSLDLNMRVDLKVRGTTNNPRIQGRIETTGGTLSFGNRTYRLTSGSLDFLDPSQINPDVTLQARTDIKDYQIFLTISGTLKDFSLSLSSDPPLPEKDITALLAFGGTSEQLFGIFGNLGAQQVVRLLIPPVQSQFGGRLEKLTRLDRFEVESLDKQDGTTSAIFTPQVVIGKEFFKDLFVTFSTTIGTAQEKQVVQLRYVISNRFSLIVERDNENQTNVSARMRFEFK